MEKDISFPAHDGKTIYATYNKTASEKCRGLIIYAHGLPSNRNDYTYLQSARLFTKKGYDTLRISFYDWQKNARNLKDCGFEEHAHDLETTIKKFKSKYKRIYLIGHSWGGPTILQTSMNGIAAVSLWDPSYNVPFWWDACFRKEGKYIFLTGPCDAILSPRMHAAAQSLDYAKCEALARRFSTPLQVLHAKKNGRLYKFKKSYHTHAAGPTDYHLIAEADHCFLDEIALKKAIQHTHNWFKKF